MTKLRDHASALANEQRPASEVPAEPQRTAVASEELPDLTSYVPAEGEGWDDIPVHVAWLRVRRDIAFIGKGDAYLEGGKPKYNFRGYERVVAAFGPITLKHGVSVVPYRITPAHRDAKSSKGTAMRESTTKITWRVYGPRGDFFEMESEGESLDVGDKGTAKAQTIAQRVVLLVGGMIPTGAPDSDESHHERGEASLRPLTDYRDEIVDPNTSLARLRTIRTELREQRRLTGVLPNEVGDDEQVGAMIDRIGAERAGGGQ